MIPVRFYWVTRNRDTILKIRKRFSITEGQTINGETYTHIKEDDWKDFLALAGSGKFINIRQLNN